MFIPDPGSEFFHPGSGSASKSLSIFYPKHCLKPLGNMIRDVHPGTQIRIFFHPRSQIRIFFPIPDPGVKKAPDPGSETAKHWF
jgi:hypothetical protein